MTDIALSLGSADIIYAHINKYGYLELIILDTYDFNKDDPDWKCKSLVKIEKDYYTLVESDGAIVIN